jgi:2-keto-4-pentenoate hydratase/2-oxohepta-3-ene-1,7-dioic acid hydratase in catechol pathway
MKLFRYGPPGQERPGVLDRAGARRDLGGLVPDITPAWLASPEFHALRSIDRAALPLIADEERLGPPVSGVGKIVCVGLNYHDHAREVGMTPPTEPALFMKATSAITGPFDPILLPRDHSKVDWEIELGIVIGRLARHVDERDALEHVAGYCIVNDVSERRFQLECGGQWTKGKSCDTFAPLGPYLVTRDEAAAAVGLRLWLDVNGERMQSSSTSEMVFGVGKLVHYISRFMTLQPGDIIATGTPAGVAFGMKEPRWLQAGDTLRFGIDGLGEQSHAVIAAGADR